METDMLACINVDGVLADFEGAFCKKFGWTGRNLTSLEMRFPDRADEIELFVAASSTYERLDILPLGVEIVRFLYGKGFDIHIVSSRPSYCTQITGLWLKQNKIPFHYMSVGERNKVSTYVNLRPFLVLEDLFSVAEETYRFGINSFIIDQPWNFSLSSNGVRRVRTFEKFRRDFEEISQTLMEI